VLWHLGKPADAEQIWAEAGAVDRDNRLLKETRHRLNAEATPIPGAGQPAPAISPTPTIRPMPTTWLAPARQPLDVIDVRLANQLPDVAGDGRLATPALAVN
jgi:hypothetical protein